MRRPGARRRFSKAMGDNVFKLVAALCADGIIVEPLKPSKNLCSRLMPEHARRVNTENACLSARPARGIMRVHARLYVLRLNRWRFGRPGSSNHWPSEEIAIVASSWEGCA